MYDDEGPGVVIFDRPQRLRDLLLAESEITDCKMYGQFRDDGLPCYNLSVTVNTEEFKFSIWCVADASLLFAFARAPFLPEDHKRIVEFILHDTDPEKILA
ncbi:hypothetical protein D3C79_971750 [compost metagenome]